MTAPVLLVLTVLKEQGKSNNEIQVVTGHKNEQSVSRYIRHRKDSDIRSLSSALTSGHLEDGECTDRKVMKIDSNDLCSSSNSMRVILSGNFENCTFNFPSSGHCNE